MYKTLAVELLKYIGDPVNRGIPISTDDLVQETQNKGLNTSREIVESTLSSLFSGGYVYQTGGFWYPTTPGLQTLEALTKGTRKRINYSDKLVSDYANLYDTYKGFTPRQRNKKGWKDWEAIVKKYLPTFRENHPEYETFIKYLLVSPANWAEFVKDTQALYLKWDFNKEVSLRYPDETEYEGLPILSSIEQVMDESIRKYYKYIQSDRHKIFFNTEYRSALDLIKANLPELIENANSYLKSLPKGTVITDKALINQIKPKAITGVDPKIIDNVIIKAVANNIDYTNGRFVQSTLENIMISGVRELLAFNTKASNVFNTFRDSLDSLDNVDQHLLLSEIVNSVVFDTKDLEGINFNGLSISGVSFKGTNLSKSKWEASLVNNCNFTGANFQNAIFIPTECLNNVFTNADFTGATVDKDIEWENNIGYPLNLSIKDIDYDSEQLPRIVKRRDIVVSYALPIKREDYTDALTILKALKPLIDRFQTISSKRLNFSKFAVRNLAPSDVEEIRKFLKGEIERPSLPGVDNVWEFFIDLNKEKKFQSAGFTGKEINTLMGKARNITPGVGGKSDKDKEKENAERVLQEKINSFQSQFQNEDIIPIKALHNLVSTPDSSLSSILNQYADREGFVNIKSLYSLYNSIFYTLKGLHINNYKKPIRYYEAFPYLVDVIDLQETTRHNLEGKGKQFSIFLTPNYTAMSQRMSNIVAFASKYGSSHIDGAIAFSRITPFKYTVVPVGRKRAEKFNVWYISEMQADDYQKIGKGDREFNSKITKQFGRDVVKEYRDYFRQWPENLLNAIITKAIENNVDQIWMPEGAEVAKKTHDRDVNWYNYYDRPAKGFGGEYTSVGVDINLDPGSSYNRKGSNFYVIDLKGIKANTNLDFNSIEKVSQLKEISFIRVAEYDWDQIKENLEHHFDFFLSRHRDLHNAIVNQVTTDDMVIQWAYRTFFDEYNISRPSREDPEFMNEVRRMIVEDLGFKLFGHPYIDWLYWLQKAHDDVLWFIPKQRALLGVNISDKELARDWWLLWSQDQIPPDIKIAQWFDLFKDTVRDLIIAMNLGDIYDDTVYYVPESEEERVPESEHQEGTEGEEYVDPTGKPVEGPPTGVDEIADIQAEYELEQLRTDLLNQYLDELSDAQATGDTRKVEFIKQRLDELQSMTSLDLIGLRKLSWGEYRENIDNLDFNKVDKGVIYVTDKIYPFGMKGTFSVMRLTRDPNGKGDGGYTGWTSSPETLKDSFIDLREAIKYAKEQVLLNPGYIYFQKNNITDKLNTPSDESNTRTLGNIVYNTNRRKIYGQDSQETQENNPQAEENNAQESPQQAPESPQKTELDIYYPDVDDIINFHDDVVKKYGGRPGLFPEGRDKLDAAIGRMKSAFAGQEFYPSLFEKAAVLMHSIITTHPFVDGNKRAAYVAGVMFLQYNDFDLDDSEELAELIIKVAESQSGYDHLLEWVGKNARHLIERHAPSLKILTWDKKFSPYADKADDELFDEVTRLENLQDSNPDNEDERKEKVDKIKIELKLRGYNLGLDNTLSWQIHIPRYTLLTDSQLWENFDYLTELLDNLAESEIDKREWANKQIKQIEDELENRNYGREVDSSQKLSWNVVPDRIQTYDDFKIMIENAEVNKSVRLKNFYYESFEIDYTEGYGYSWVLRPNYDIAHMSSPIFPGEGNTVIFWKKLGSAKKNLIKKVNFLFNEETGEVEDWVKNRLAANSKLSWKALDESEDLYDFELGDTVVWIMKYNDLWYAMSGKVEFDNEEDGYTADSRGEGRGIVEGGKDDFEYIRNAAREYAIQNNYKYFISYPERQQLKKITLSWKVEPIDVKLIVYQLNVQEEENKNQPGYIDNYYSTAHPLTKDQAIAINDAYASKGGLPNYDHYYLAVRHMLDDGYYDLVGADGTDAPTVVDVIEPDIISSLPQISGFINQTLSWVQPKKWENINTEMSNKAKYLYESQRWKEYVPASFKPMQKPRKYQPGEPVYIVKGGNIPINPDIYYYVGSASQRYGGIYILVDKNGEIRKVNNIKKIEEVDVEHFTNYENRELIAPLLQEYREDIPSTSIDLSFTIDGVYLKNVKKVVPDVESIPQLEIYKGAKGKFIFWDNIKEYDRTIKRMQKGTSILSWQELKNPQRKFQVGDEVYVVWKPELLGRWAGERVKIIHYDDTPAKFARARYIVEGLEGDVKGKTKKMYSGYLVYNALLPPPGEEKLSWKKYKLSSIEG